MTQKTLIIDCDPGVDDAFALFYAMADEAFHIPLITTVSGNVNVDITTENARRIVVMANKKIEIAKGADKPLVAEPFYATYIHGNNGMGDYQFKDDNLAPLSELSAVQALKHHLTQAVEPVTIAALGPLTNIAHLIMLHPELIEKIECLSVMGGGLKGGNTTPAAEFNFLVDPEAAQIVFNSNIPIIMAGLNVTEQAFIDKTHLDDIKNTGPIGEFLSEVIVAARRQNSVNFRTSLHDVVSIMVLNHEEIFEYETLKIVIETQGLYTRGMSVADRRLANREEGKVKVLTKINHDRFLDLLYSKLRTYQ